MGIGAVILNYNDASETIACAFRTEAFTLVERVAVVDNASSDDSFARMEEAFAGHAKISLIQSPANGGYGAGNNKGIKYLKEETDLSLALIMNPDTVCDEELVEKLASVFDTHEDAALAGAVMKGDKSDFSYNDYLLSGWKERSFLGEVVHSGPIMKRLFRGLINYPLSYYNSAEGAVRVYAVHGSFLVADIDKFLTVGGFDEDFFLYGEEYALGARLKHAGFSTYLVLSGYEHAGSHTITGAGLHAVARQKLRRDSELIYYRKYLHAGATELLIARIVGAIVLLETRVFYGRK